MLVEIVRVWIGRGLHLVGCPVYRFEGLSMESLVFFLTEYVETGQMIKEQLQGVPFFGLFNLLLGPIARIVVVAGVGKISLYVCIGRLNPPRVRSATARSAPVRNRR